MINENLKNANILIIDDQDFNIYVLEGFLRLLGYTNIKSTTNSDMAVCLFKSFAPDLILLDLMMPPPTGYQVMEQLKELIPLNTYLPILVLTADITTDARQNALAAGAKDFLSKPFELLEVGLRIDNLLFARHLHLQMQDQNKILEEKVKERTIELQKINADLIASRDKAEASDRLKSEFLRTISHEIRTPLNGILGIASLLAESKLPEEKKLEYVDLMHDSSNRLVNTINDYVDMALIGSGNVNVNYESVYVGNLLDEIKNKYYRQFKAKNLQICLLLPDDQDELTIQTDQVLLQKALVHLMGNAVKFTFEGNIDLGFSVKQDTIEFFVKDTGVGIDENIKELIFKIFMQGETSVSRTYEGSGLGLSIVSGIVNLLGGEIRFESVRGKGTTFIITLPLNQ